MPLQPGCGTLSQHTGCLNVFICSPAIAIFRQAESLSQLIFQMPRAYAKSQRWPPQAGQQYHVHQKQAITIYKEFAVRKMQVKRKSQKASAKMMPACTMTGRHDVSPKGREERNVYQTFNKHPSFRSTRKRVYQGAVAVLCGFLCAGLIHLQCEGQNLHSLQRSLMGRRSNYDNRGR